MPKLNPYPPRVLDLNADPIALGTLELTEAGTSTPVTLYSDPALSTSLGTSATADANGFFADVYAAAGVYDVIYKDAAGALITEIERVPVSDRDGAVEFANVAALVADDKFTYANDAAYTGAIWWAQDEQVAYEVAASGATDHHLSTAGGVKLYLRPSPGRVWPMSALNLTADNSTDNSTTLQRVIDYIRAEGGGTLLNDITSGVVGVTTPLYLYSEMTFEQVDGAHLSNVRDSSGETDTSNFWLFTPILFGTMFAFDSVANGKTKGVFGLAHEDIADSAAIGARQITGVTGDWDSADVGKVICISTDEVFGGSDFPKHSCMNVIEGVSGTSGDHTLDLKYPLKEALPTTGEVRIVPTDPDDAAATLTGLASFGYTGNLYVARNSHVRGGTIGMKDGPTATQAIGKALHVACFESTITGVNFVGGASAGVTGNPFSHSVLRDCKMVAYGIGLEPAYLCESSYFEGNDFAVITGGVSTVTNQSGFGIGSEGGNHNMTRGNRFYYNHTGTVSGSDLAAVRSNGRGDQLIDNEIYAGNKTTACTVGDNGRVSGGTIAGGVSRGFTGGNIIESSGNPARVENVRFIDTNTWTGSAVNFQNKGDEGFVIGCDLGGTSDTHVVAVSNMNNNSVTTFGNVGFTDDSSGTELLNEAISVAGTASRNYGVTTYNRNFVTADAYWRCVMGGSVTNAADTITFKVTLGASTDSSTVTIPDTVGGEFVAEAEVRAMNANNKAVTIKVTLQGGETYVVAERLAHTNGSEATADVDIKLVTTATGSGVAFFYSEAWEYKRGTDVYVET